MGDHVVTEVRKSRLSLVYLPEQAVQCQCLLANELMPFGYGRASGPGILGAEGRSPSGEHRLTVNLDADSIEAHAAYAECWHGDASGPLFSCRHTGVEFLARGRKV